MTETQANTIEKWIELLDHDLRNQYHRTFAPYEKMELLGLLRALRPEAPKARVSGVPYEVEMKPVPGSREPDRYYLSRKEIAE